MMKDRAISDHPHLQELIFLGFSNLDYHYRPTEFCPKRGYGLCIKILVHIGLKSFLFASPSTGASAKKSTPCLLELGLSLPLELIRAMFWE